MPQAFSGFCQDGSSTAFLSGNHETATRIATDEQVSANPALGLEAHLFQASLCKTAVTKSAPAMSTHGSVKMSYLNESQYRNLVTVSTQMERVNRLPARKAKGNAEDKSAAMTPPVTSQYSG